MAPKLVCSMLRGKMFRLISFHSLSLSLSLLFKLDSSLNVVSHYKSGPATKRTENNKQTTRRSGNEVAASLLVLRILNTEVRCGNTQPALPHYAATALATAATLTMSFVR